MTDLICLGLGYSAEAWARRLAPRGWRITGSTTRPTGTSRITALGYDAAVFDGTAPSPGVRKALETATHVLISAAPDADGDPILRHHAADIEAGPSTWIGYLSTIGVYGDWQGAWVDETTPANPSSPRSVRRLAAEEAWLDLAQRSGKRVEIFRLAGIYGPGRGGIENLRDGSARRIIKPGQVFNRIHVEDIAATLDAAIAQPFQHAIYNVTDDEPAPPQDVVAFAAGLLNLPVPPAIAFEDAGLSDMARSFYSENKRVRNDRIKQALGVNLQFPTFREGLAALAAGAS